MKIALVFIKLSKYNFWQIQDSAVSIVTRLVVDHTEFESWQGQEIYLFKNVQTLSGTNPVSFFSKYQGLSHWG
jgi:hypothetical protein